MTATTDRNYSYDPDDTLENVIQVYVTDDLMKGTSKDTLRNELGYMFSTTKYESPEGLLGKELITTNGHVQTEVEDLRGYTYAKLTCNSKYIDFLEIMPSQITSINAKGMFPNLKVPVRLYASEGTVYDDKFWRTLFTGGKYGNQEFPSLINTNTIFNDYSFTYANSYTTLYAKTVGINESCPNINQILSHYNDYNLDIRDHQAWASSLENPLLIPSYYILSTIAYIDDDYFGSLISNPARQLSPSLQLYTALSASNDSYGLDNAILHEKLHDIGGKLRDNGNHAAKKYFETLYLPTLRVQNFNDTVKQDTIRAQRNIILSDKYFQSFGESPVDIDIFPFYT